MQNRDEHEDDAAPTAPESSSLPGVDAAPAEAAAEPPPEHEPAAPESGGDPFAADPDAAAESESETAPAAAEAAPEQQGASDLDTAPADVALEPAPDNEPASPGEPAGPVATDGGRRADAGDVPASDAGAEALAEHEPSAPTSDAPVGAELFDAPAGEPALAEDAPQALVSEALSETADVPEEEEPSLPAQEVRAIVEALVFAAPQPVTPRQIGQVLGGVAKQDWLAALEQLKADYAVDGRGLQLVEVAGGWQITTRPEYNDWVRELLDPKTPTRLSIQALETLAVIAYKQPVTLPEVIALRGVKSGGVIKTLLEKRLIRITGRKEVVGRPMLYGTTKEFLLHFGMKDLGELPKIEEFAEVLGEEVDVAGLKKAIEAPTPVEEVPLSEPEPEGAPGAPEASDAEEPDDGGMT